MTLLRLMVVFSVFFTSLVNAASDMVLIDFSEKAYTVYAGLPRDKAEAAKAKLEGKPVDMLTFDAFQANPGRTIDLRVIRNDYATDRTAEGISELIKKYPGTPFGVTWNGGIAFTRNDYQAAKNTFEAFNSPTGFSKPVPEKDPVAPMNHLKPLLGW